MSYLGEFVRKIGKVLKKNPNTFLKNVTGVIHIGANVGQEREIYAGYGLKVIWVEPIPEVFAELRKNIKTHNKQQAFQALITDLDQKEYTFHIANNAGASSSILKLKDHKDIWPDVTYTRSITLDSTTLATLLKRENIKPMDYQALIMDTQGSELLVLKGSLSILQHFKYIKIEVADFESYEGCCTLADVTTFMVDHGYNEYVRVKFAHREEGGSYFDIVYKKTGLT